MTTQSRVVGAGFLILTLSTGFGFYSLSLYTQELITRPAIDVGDASVGATLLILFSGIVALPLPRLQRWIPIHRMMMFGAVLSGVGLVLLGQATDRTSMLIAYGLYGAGFGLTATVPITTVLTSWFRDQFARPLAITMSGFSFGGVVITPLVAYFIASHGLRSVLTIAGPVFVASMFVLVYFFFYDADDSAMQDAIADTERKNLGIAGSLLFSAEPGVCGIGAAFTVIIGVQVATVVHILPIGASRGVKDASWALSLLAVSSLVGRIVVIPLLPRVKVNYIVASMALSLSLGLLALAVMESSAGLRLGSILVGIVIGNNVALLPILLAAIFGVEHVRSSYSVVQFMTVMGMAIGPIAFGVVMGVTSSYQAALFSSSALVFLCGLFVLTLRPSQTRA